MSALSELPVVTVEQVVRFREAAMQVERRLSESEVELRLMQDRLQGMKAAYEGTLTANSKIREQCNELRVQLDSAEESCQKFVMDLGVRDLRIEDAEQQCAELLTDAERYRWLRENRNVLLLTGFFGNGCTNRTIDEVDSMIDQAIAKAVLS